MAIYPSDAVGPFTTEHFSSMADSKPDKGFTEQRQYNSVIFESEGGYEKRRLRSRRSKRSFDLRYTNITGLEKAAIESFYNERAGDFESFSFDLTHVNQSGNLTVRFDGPLQITQVLSDTNANLLSNFYTISFKLQETYD
jgi:hypothetical protein